MFVSIGGSTRSYASFSSIKHSHLVTCIQINQDFLSLFTILCFLRPFFYFFSVTVLVGINIDIVKNTEKRFEEKLSSFWGSIIRYGHTFPKYKNISIFRHFFKYRTCRRYVKINFAYSFCFSFLIAVMYFLIQSLVQLIIYYRMKTFETKIASLKDVLSFNVWWPLTRQDSRLYIHLLIHLFIHSFSIVHR